MFGGKRMSSTDKFIMAKGREAGNLKKIEPPAKAANRKGRGNPKAALPVPKKIPNGDGAKAASLNQGKGLSAGKTRPQPLGQVGTFSGKVVRK